MTASSEELAHGQARIISNTGYLLVASIIQKVISAGFVFYYFKVLGKSGAGDFEPVRSAIPIVLLLIDLSLSVVLTRETSRQPEKAWEYLSNVLTVKFALAALWAISIAASFAVFGYDHATRQLIPIAGLVVFLDMITMSLTMTLRGLQIFQYEAMGIIITQVATVLVGAISFAFGARLVGLMSALAVGSLVNFTFLLTVVKRKLGQFPALRWNSALVKSFLIIALPILGAALMAKIFTYTDRYLLLTFAGKSAFAEYAAAHKIPFSLEFIAAAFAASLLPAMSRLFIHQRQQLHAVVETAFRYLILVSVPLAVGGFILAEPLVLKLYSVEFQASIPLFQIMILALPLIFLNFPLGSFLIATNRQVWNTVNLSVAVVFNVLFNVLLQPSLGATAAALAVTITYFLLFGLGLVQLLRVTSLNGRVLLVALLKTCLAAAVMAGGLYLFRNTWSLFLLIPLGLVLFGATAMLIGALSPRDLGVVQRFLSRKPAV